MKLRHAVGLAVVGWYLMVPPMAHEEDWQPGGPPTTAPLSEWFIWKSFDAADACEKAKYALFGRALENNGNDNHRWLAGRAPSDDLLDEWASTCSTFSALNSAFRQSQCIATDDPRLDGD